MKEFMEKFYETRDMWEKMLDNVESYVFGEEEPDTDVFADAMRGAFEVFSEMYPPASIAVLGSPQELGANHLMSIFGIISEYTADRYIVEPNNVTFRATQFAARLLLNGTKSAFIQQEDGVFRANEIIDYYCSEEGDKEYIDDCYGDSIEDFIYDIYKGDLSDLIELMEALT